MPPQLPKYLRRSQAAEYVRTTIGIPCSARWLAKLAVEGGGPPFHKAGRFPMYTPTELVAWAEARIGRAQSSTSDGFTLDLSQKPKVDEPRRSTWIIGGRK